MSKVLEVVENRSIKFELKLALVLLLIETLLGGVGLGLAFMTSSLITYTAWIPILVALPFFSVAFLFRHYFKKIDNV